MKKTKVLIVSDGGVTSKLMEKMFELEQYGAEVSMIEDKRYVCYGTYY